MRFKLKRELLLLVAVFSSRVCAKNYLQTRLGRTQLAGGGVGGSAKASRLELLGLRAKWSSCSSKSQDAQSQVKQQLGTVFHKVQQRGSQGK